MLMQALYFSPVICNNIKKIETTMKSKLKDKKTQSFKINCSLFWETKIRNFLNIYLKMLFDDKKIIISLRYFKVIFWSKKVLFDNSYEIIIEVLPVLSIDVASNPYKIEHEYVN